MSNESYLIVSYFCIATVCICLAVGVFLLLRNPFNKLVSQHFFLLLKKIFFIGILFPALFGFFSVSFKSCSADSYDKIIEKRSYLIEKNQEQLAASLKQITIALLVWMILTFGVAIVIKHVNNRNVS